MLRFFLTGTANGSVAILLQLRLTQMALNFMAEAGDEREYGTGTSMQRDS